MKKVAIIAMALILALGAIGVGFAKWTDSVTINGTVTTGKVQVGILDVSTMDPGPNYAEPGGDLYPTNSPVDGTVDPQNKDYACNIEGKNVASHNSVNDGDPAFTKVIGGESYGFYKSVTETIKNAYPFYLSGTELWVTNNGTIPVKVTSIDEDIRDDEGFMNLFPWMEIYSISVIEIDVDGNQVGDPIYSDGDWQAMQAALDHFQLDPCHTLVINISFYFEEYDDGELEANGSNEIMPQNATMEFTWTVNFAQWNEVNCPQVIK